MEKRRSILKYLDNMCKHSDCLFYFVCMMFLISVFLPFYYFRFHDLFGFEYNNHIFLANNIRGLLFGCVCVSQFVIWIIVKNIFFFVFKKYTLLAVIPPCLFSLSVINLNLTNMIYYHYYQTWIPVDMIYYYLVKDLYWVLPMVLRNYFLISIFVFLIIGIIDVIVVKSHLVEFSNLKDLMTFKKFTIRIFTYFFVILFLYKCIGFIYSVPVFDPVRKHPAIVFIESLWDSIKKDKSSYYTEYAFLRKNQYLDSIVPKKVGGLRKNIILIIVETLRRDYIYSGDKILIPEVQYMLSKGGFWVDRMYSQGPDTAISLKSIFTGVLPYKIKFIRNEVLLQNVFKKIGYRTGLFSGFTTEWKDLNDIFSEDIDIRKDLMMDHTGIDNDTLAIQFMFDWLNDYDFKKNFFIVLGIYRPHFAYRKLLYELKNSKFSEIEEEKFIYQNAVNDAFVQIKNVYDFLDKKNLLDSTIICITGDHGEAFMEHGMMYHANGVYAETVSVPLIFIDSSKKPAHLIPYASHIDVMPTLIGYIGLKPPIYIDGQDILKRSYEKSYFTVQYLDTHSLIGIIDGNFHYIKNLLYSGSCELYNDKDDPKEIKNLYQKYPDKIKAYDQWINDEVNPYI